MRTVDQFQAFTERMMLHPRLGIIPEGTCCLGLAGELGEVAELFVGNSRATLAKELGDVLWYVAALAWHYDTKVCDLLSDAPVVGSSVAEVLIVHMSAHFGKAIDHVKKLEWHGGEVDPGLVLRSLRDGLGAWKALARTYALSPDDIMAANIAKLRARHGDAFSGGAGDRSKPEAA